LFLVLVFKTQTSKSHYLPDFFDASMVFEFL